MFAIFSISGKINDKERGYYALRAPSQESAVCVTDDR